MPSLQPRIDLQQRIEAYSTLSANLLTQLGELDLLRELVRQADVAAAVRLSKVQKERKHSAYATGDGFFLMDRQRKEIGK